MSQDAIVIVSYARTPMGSFQGSLASLTAPELGAHANRAAIERANIQSNEIDEVIMGCVLPAGQGQAPARQSALSAGVPESTPCTTINKMCGSGMKALMMAHDAIKADSANIILAGGIESMSNTPYLLPKARAGYRLGHQQVLDSMFHDGLEDAYDKGQLMGVFAEATAEKYDFTREQQDEFALRSLQRAIDATEQGLFNKEISPITIKTRKSQNQSSNETEISHDEGPQNARPDKIPQLKPAFKKDGSVTAANSSSISDGAASLILMRESVAKKMGLTIIAKIQAHATHAQAPAWFTTAPVRAIEKLLYQINWTTDEVDLFEINEAFAVVTMAAMADLNLPAEKVNIHGGACALGHPIGASGARIVVTLLSALQQKNLKKGVAALCIGGGEATAMAFEMV